MKLHEVLIGAAAACLFGAGAPAQADVIATLSFDTPTATVASNVDIPVWMTLTLDSTSDPITTDASSYVTSPLSAQVISDLHGNSTGVVVNEAAGCGDTLDACNSPGTAYTFNFNFGANGFVTPANLDLEPGNSLDILLGSFTPNGGNAAAGAYEFNLAEINFQYYDPVANQTYFSNVATTSSVFTRTVFAAVPEPATWAMMLVGFGGLGAAMRSRRKLTATTA